MAANKVVIFPPITLTTATNRNLFGPPTVVASIALSVPPTSTGGYIIIRHIRVVNTTAGALSFILFNGASGVQTAGKEIIAGGVATANAYTSGGISVAANSFFEWFGMIRLDSAATDQYIVGGASAVGLTIQAEGEMGIA